ncbi:hypothetical protein C6P97_15645 [Burkholderia multivorans]|nr:hypothetical protein C6P97_15645 [Burkholderia multivorans]
MLGPAPACSGLLRPALACSGLLWPALACSGLLWPALACSGLLWLARAWSHLLWHSPTRSGLFPACSRSVPTCSDLLCSAPAPFGRLSPLRPARSHYPSSAPRPPAARSSAPSLVHLAFFAFCLVFLVTSFSLISTLKAAICGYSPVIRPVFPNKFYYTIAVNLNIPEPERWAPPFATWRGRQRSRSAPCLAR